MAGNQLSRLGQICPPGELVSRLRDRGAKVDHLEVRLAGINLFGGQKIVISDVNGAELKRTETMSQCHASDPLQIQIMFRYRDSWLEIHEQIEALTVEVNEQRRCLPYEPPRRRNGGFGTYGRKPHFDANGRAQRVNKRTRWLWGYLNDASGRLNELYLRQNEILHQMSEVMRDMQATISAQAKREMAMLLEEVRRQRTVLKAILSRKATDENGKADESTAALLKQLGDELEAEEKFLDRSQS